MLAYLDTSALAKWYLNEPRSEDFSAWVCHQQNTHISSLTALEFRCLVARRKRRGDISSELEQRLFAVFRADVQVGHLIQHPVENRDVVDAVVLLEHVFPTALRTLDAIHLRIAVRIGAAALATADNIMAAAANALGMQVFNFAN
ncbi:MAG: type II toxin-antitoxin system VapC family toxin [Nitrococcus sp.]|nr:type II toxin-antitoxin system VapC family toxin [Nitrococcus sp.]